ncbi:MAG: two-component regulator propeller domain-containing protein [Chitinophagales bacterium]
MRKVRISFILILFLLQPPVFSQQFILEEFGSRQGLASSEIYALFQDSTGYLWIGTRLGVSRFDGFGFTNYNGTSTERFGKVFSITQDGAKRIWIGAENGLFYFMAGEVHNILLDKSFPDPWIYSVHCADGKSLWIGTANGPVYLSENEIQNIIKGKPLDFKLFKNWADFGDPGNQVRRITNDVAGNIYFGTRGSVIKYDGNQLTFLWESKEPRLEDVSDIVVNNKGETFITNETGNFYKIRDSDIDTIPFFVNSTGIESYGGDKFLVLGLIGLSTLNGDQLKEVYNFETKGIDYVSCMLVDAEKNIWVGSWEGLIKLRKNIFTTYLPGNTENLNDIFSIVQSADDIVLGGNRGNVIYFKNDRFEKFLPGNLQPWTNSEVFGLYFDKNGTIWFGSGYQGISAYKDGAIFQYREDKLFDMHGQDFYEDRKSNFYILSEGGITQVMNPEFPANLQFKYFPWPVDIGGKYLKIFDHIVMENNDTYLATNFGLVFFDGDTLLPVKTTDEALNDAIITALVSDNDGAIWLSTGNDGVYNIKADKLNAEIKQHLNASSGLLSDAVLELLKTDEGIWCAHYNGLSFLKETNTTWKVVKKINEQEGFLPYDYTYIKLAEDKQAKKIWIATTNGVQYFSTQDLPFNSTFAHPVITDVLLFNGAIPISNYGTKTTLSKLIPNPVFPYNKNSVTFQFQAVSLTIPAQNICRYKLIGYDTTWYYAKGIDEVTYAALAPGKYRFVLQAANNDGIWSSISDNYDFTIRKPFWATWWFIVSAIILTALISYSIYKYRLNQLIRINSLRTKIAGDLHDDIGSTLSSIRMYSDIVANQLSDKNSESTPLLQKMSENSTEMIENMSDIVWAIKPTNDSFKNIESRMFNFVTSLTNARNIELVMEKNESIEGLKLPMDERRDLYLIFKEAVNNSMKYANATKLNIHFTKTGSGLKMMIKDNGKGFDTALHNDGNGLGNMKKRAVEHKWKLVVNSALGKGTEVILSW